MLITSPPSFPLYPYTQRFENVPGSITEFSQNKFVRYQEESQAFFVFFIKKIYDLRPLKYCKDLIFKRLSLCRQSFQKFLLQFHRGLLGEIRISACKYCYSWSDRTIYLWVSWTENGNCLNSYRSSQMCNPAVIT